MVKLSINSPEIRINEKTFRDRGSRLVFVMGLLDFFKKKKPNKYK